MKDGLKILILCPYFNRPKLVRKTLASVLMANEHHKNWVLAFGDDGSAVPGKPIVEEILKDHLHKVIFVPSNMSLEDKLSQGIIIGRLANGVMRETDAEAAIILCDDDELYPTYLRELSQLFTIRSEMLYCYSKIHLFNPLFQKTDKVDNITGRYNSWIGPIDPVGKVDASQVAWRIKCCTEYGAWFADSTMAVDGRPWTKDTDRSFFENLYQKCGPCQPSGLIAQYKGIHDYQLLWHKNVGIEKLKEYESMCRQKAGEVF